MNRVAASERDKQKKQNQKTKASSHHQGQCIPVGYSVNTTGSGVNYYLNSNRIRHNSVTDGQTEMLKQYCPVYAMRADMR